MKQFNENELDGLFRDKLAGEEATPPGMVWNKIEKELDGTSRRPGAWLWWLSGIILLLGIGTWYGVMKNNFANSNDSKKIVAVNNSSNTTISSSTHSTNASTSTANSVSTNSIISPVDSSVSAQAVPESSISKNNSEAIKNNNPVSKKNLNSNTTTLTSSDKNSSDAKKQVAKNHSNSKSDAKSKSVYSDNSDFEKNNQPLPDAVTTIKVKTNNSPDKNSFSSDQNKKQTGTADDGSKIQLPQKLTDYAKNPVANSDSTFAPDKQKIIVDNNYDTHWKDANQLQIQQHINDSIQAINTLIPILPKQDETKIIPTTDYKKKINPIDSTKNSPPPTPVASTFDFPLFFAAIHGGFDQTKVVTANFSTNGYTHDDIGVYVTESHKYSPEQTYSYGGRFGWFVTKHISIMAGANYSIFSLPESGGLLKYDHNYTYNFTFHSPTSSVKLSSTNFGMEDNVGPYGDTSYVNVKATERYDFLNLQLGTSVYALRTKHFGVYANILSNGALLAKEQMTLTSPHSGKSFSFSGNQLSGMSKFVLGGQTGIGFEWNIVKSVGLWIEPTYFFSGVMNKNNAVTLKPGGMKYLFGMAYHF